MPVYMIQAGESGPVKIGWANEPERRLQELQVGNGERLRVLRLFVGGRTEEVRLHKMFSEKRLYGEWFSFDPPMLSDDLGLTPIQLAGSADPEKGDGPGVFASIQQMKAARALLGWDQREAAAMSGLSVPTIQRMETLGLGRSSLDNAERIRKTFETAGIEFQDDGAPGVRLHPRGPVKAEAGDCG